MSVSRREVLTGSMGGVLLGDQRRDLSAAPLDEEQLENIVQVLKAMLGEAQSVRRSPLAGDVASVGTLRERMLDFMRSTNKWPDFIDVGHGVWFTLYDWHIRFGQQPVVVRLPPPDNNRYGLTFMFTTLVLRLEHAPTYIGMAYDREK